MWSQNATIGPSTRLHPVETSSASVRILAECGGLLYNNTLIVAYMGLPIPQMLSLSFSISIQYTMKNLEGQFPNIAFMSQFHYQYTSSRLQFRNMFSVLPIPKHLYWKSLWIVFQFRWHSKRI